LERASGRLEFRDVGFAYGGDPPVLHDVSFSLESGESLGIAGPTGAGKTTLISLVTRLYDPIRGAVLLDGVDLRDLRLADLRNQFAIVLQEPVLFSASIAENIAYARPGAGEDEIVAAAEAAGAHSFIVGLPEGYATHVGERGMRLSGGERQRISLARAFLKDAPILVLDEPTSSVDVATERLIMAAMRRLMAGRTTLMIAHRLSTLDECDRRLELDRGRIVTLSTAAKRPPPGRSRGGTSRRRVAPDREAVEEHPAAQAWHRLDLGPPPEAVEVVRTPNGRRVWKSQVYRLRGAGPLGESVIAKRAGLEGIRVEDRVYQEVLPQVLLATIGCYGSIEDPGSEVGWLFLEDAQGEPFDDAVSEHRALAGEWLGALHLRTAKLDLADRLPDRGTSWYLSKLEAARQRIGESLQNPALSDEALSSLQRVIEQAQLLAAVWDEVDRFGHAFPPVLVHGDFTAKNVLVSAPSSGRRLSVMDWDIAGWGVPASDAAATDLASYRRTIGASWGQISSTKWRGLAAMGTILRLTLWIDAESCALSGAWVGRPVRKLKLYGSALERALGDLNSRRRSIS
jgi:ABC-type multidrug transport system ATPase subunit